MKFTTTTALLSLLAATAQAQRRRLADLVFDDRTTFTAAMNGGDIQVDEFDTYGAPSGTSSLDLTDAQMNALSNEVGFSATSENQLNMIWDRNGDKFYCAGCNGAFELDFTVGTADGVYGVGFDIENFIFCGGNLNGVFCQGQQAFGCAATVTYGNGDTEIINLPDKKDTFWGVADKRLIKKVEVGKRSSAALFRFQIDSLTFGGTAPEEPSAAPSPVPSAAPSAMPSAAPSPTLNGAPTMGPTDTTDGDLGGNCDRPLSLLLPGCK